MHWVPRQINKKTGQLCSGHNTMLMKEKQRRNKGRRNNDGVQPQGFGAFATPTFQVKAISDNPPSLLWSVTIRPDKAFRSVEAAFKKFWWQHNNNCSKTVQFSQNKTWCCRIFFFVKDEYIDYSSLMRRLLDEAKNMTNNMLAYWRLAFMWNIQQSAAAKLRKQIGIKIFLTDSSR